MSAIRTSTNYTLRSTRLPAAPVSPKNSDQQDVNKSASTAKETPKESIWTKFKDEMKHVGEEIKEGAEKFAKETKEFVTNEFEQAYHSQFVQGEIADAKQFIQSGKHYVKEVWNDVKQEAIPQAEGFLQNCATDLIHCAETGTLKSFGTDLLNEGMLFGKQLVADVKTDALKELGQKDGQDMLQALKDMMHMDQNNSNPSNKPTLANYC